MDRAFGPERGFGLQDVYGAVTNEGFFPFAMLGVRMTAVMWRHGRWRRQTNKQPQVLRLRISREAARCFALDDTLIGWLSSARGVRRGWR